MEILYYPILWVIVLLIALEITSTYYNRLVLRMRTYRLFSWLGVFVHEFSHWIFCKLTGAKVFEFRVGRFEGHVKHSKSRIPIFGAMLISLGPLIIGIGIMLASFMWVAGIDYEYIKNILQTENSLNIFKHWSNIDLISWKFLLYLFINFNILAVFAPSRQDYKNIALFLALYIIASIFIKQLNPLNVLIANILLFSFILMISITLPLGLWKKLRRN